MNQFICISNIEDLPISKIIDVAKYASSKKGGPSFGEAFITQLSSKYKRYFEEDLDKPVLSNVTIDRLKFVFEKALQELKRRSDNFGIAQDMKQLLYTVGTRRLLNRYLKERAEDLFNFDTEIKVQTQIKLESGELGQQETQIPLWQLFINNLESLGFTKAEISEVIDGVKQDTTEEGKVTPRKPMDFFNLYINRVKQIINRNSKLYSELEKNLADSFRNKYLFEGDQYTEKEDNQPEGTKNKFETTPNGVAKYKYREGTTAYSMLKEGFIEKIGQCKVNFDKRIIIHDNNELNRLILDYKNKLFQNLYSYLVKVIRSNIDDSIVNEYARNPEDPIYKKAVAFLKGNATEQNIKNTISRIIAENLLKKKLRAYGIESPTSSIYSNKETGEVSPKIVYALREIYRDLRFRGLTEDSITDMYISAAQDASSAQEINLGSYSISVQDQVKALEAFTLLDESIFDDFMKEEFNKLIEIQVKTSRLTNLEKQKYGFKMSTTAKNTFSEEEKSGIQLMGNFAKAIIPTINEIGLDGKNIGVKLTAEKFFGQVLKLRDMSTLNLILNESGVLNSGEIIDLIADLHKSPVENMIKICESILKISESSQWKPSITPTKNIDFYRAIYSFYNAILNKHNPNSLISIEYEDFKHRGVINNWMLTEAMVASIDRIQDAFYTQYGQNWSTKRFGANTIVKGETDFIELSLQNTINLASAHNTDQITREAILKKYHVDKKSNNDDKASVDWRNTEMKNGIPQFVIIVGKYHYKLSITSDGALSLIATDKPREKIKVNDKEKEMPLKDVLNMSVKQPDNLTIHRALTNQLGGIDAETRGGELFFIKLLEFIDDTLQMGWSQGRGRYDILETYLRDNSNDSDPLKNLKPLLALAVQSLRNHIAYYDYFKYKSSNKSSNKAEESEEVSSEDSNTYNISRFIIDRRAKYGDTYRYDAIEGRLTTYTRNNQQQEAIKGLATAEQWLSGDLFRARLRNVMGNNIPPNKMYNLAGNLQYYLKQNVNNPILKHNLFVQNYSRHRGTSIKTGFETINGVKKEVTGFTVSEHLYSAIWYDFFGKGYEGYRSRTTDKEITYPTKPESSEINRYSTIPQATTIEFQSTCNADKKSVHLFGADSMLAYTDSKGHSRIIDVFRDSPEKLRQAILDTVGSQYNELYTQVYQDYRYIFNNDYLRLLSDRILKANLTKLVPLAQTIQAHLKNNTPRISFLLQDSDLRSLLNVTSLEELNVNSKVSNEQSMNRNFILNVILPNLKTESYANREIINKLTSVLESTDEDFILSDLLQEGIPYAITQQEYDTILRDYTGIELYENLHYNNVTKAEYQQLPIAEAFDKDSGKVVFNVGIIPLKMKTLMSNDVLDNMHDNIFANENALQRRIAQEQKNFLLNLVKDYNMRFEFRRADGKHNSEIDHALWLMGMDATTFEKDWVDLRTNYLIVGKGITAEGESVPITIKNFATIDQYSSIQLNPLLEQYFLADYLLSENNRIITTGSSVAHAKKGAKGSDLVEMAALFSESSRTMAHFKRNVAVPATQNPLLQKSLTGPRLHRRVAVYPDRSASMFNVAGLKADEDAHDGSSFDNPLFAILLNMALQDSAVGEDKKLIDIALSKFGGQILEKYAVFMQYNARMRQSQGSPINMREHVKAWNSFKFDEPIDLNHSLTGAIINVNDLVHGGGYYMVSADEATLDHIDINGVNHPFKAGSYRKVLSLTTKNAESHEYEVVTEEVDKSGTPKEGSKCVQNIKIESLWDLMHVFGDCYSVSLKNGVLDWSDSSLYTVINYMNNIGNHIEGTDPMVMTQDSYYQPLKNSKYMISSATNKSGFKVGVSHLCDKKVWSDPSSNLQFTVIETTGLGPQGDFDHTVAGGEHIAQVTEPSQIISALEANGWTHSIVKHAYEDLGRLTVSSVQEVKDAVDKLTQNGYSKTAKSDLYHFVGQLVMQHVLADKKNDIGVARRIMERLENEFKNLERQVKKESKELNHVDDAFQLGFSDPNVFSISLAQFTSTLNKQAIKHKFFGEGAVMAPAYDISCYFTVNGQKLLYDDVEKLAIVDGVTVPIYLRNQQFQSINEQTLLPQLDLTTGRVQFKSFKEITENPLVSTVTQIPVLSDGSIVTKYVSQIDPVQDKSLKLQPMHEMVPGMKALVLFSDGTTRYCDFEDFDLYIAVKHRKPYKDSSGRVWNRGEGTIQAIPMGFTLAAYCNSEGFNPFEGNMHSIGQNLQAQNTYWSVEGVQYNLYDIPQIQEVIRRRRNAEENNEKISKEEDMLLNKQVQTVLNALSRGYMPVLSTDPNAMPDFISGSFVKKIDEGSLQSTAAEMMISRIQMEQFNLGATDSLARILEDGETYFKDKIQKALHLSNIAGNEYDIAFTKANGRHTYIKFDTRNVHRKNSIYDFERGNFKTYKGKIWRIDKDGNKLYQVGEVIKDEQGNVIKKHYIEIYENNDGDEILVCNNTDYLAKLYQSDAYLAVLPSYYTKSPVVKEFITATFPEMAKELKSFDYDEISDYYQKNINTLAKKQFASFQASLDYTVGRIPAQAHQSFMKMKVVGFLDSDKNVVNVSHYQTWLQGSDYDIDKAYIIGYSFDDNGGFIGWSSEFDYFSYKTLLKSMELPTPSYQQARFVENGLDVTNEVNSLIEKTNVLNSISVSDENLKEAAIISVLQAKKELLDKINDYKEVDSMTEEEGILLQFTPISYQGEISDEVQNVLNMINKHNLYFENNPKSTVEGFKNSISSKIQQVISHPSNGLSSYTPINMKDPQKAAENSTSGEAIKTMTNWNPVTKFLLTVQNMSGKQVIGIAATGEKIFFALSYFYNELMQSGDLQNEKLKNNAFFQATLKKIKEMKGIDGEGDEYTYKQIVEVFKHSPANVNFTANATKEEDYIDVDGVKLSKSQAVWYDLIVQAMSSQGCSSEVIQQTLQDELGLQEDQSLIISALLSAATDNAKELILSKINAGPELAGLYLHMIIMGYSFQEAADFMTSPTVEAIAKLCETNAFDSYSLNNKRIVDNAVELLENGPDMERYGVGYLEKTFYDNARKLFSEVLGVKQKDLTDAKIKELLLNPDFALEYVDETSGLVITPYDDINDVKFYRWLDQLNYIRILRKQVNKEELEAFKHIKQQAQMTTTVGAVLGANQGFDTDFGGKLANLQQLERIMFDGEKRVGIYKVKDFNKFNYEKTKTNFFNKVLGTKEKPGINPWLSKEYVEKAFEDAVQLGIIGQNFSIDKFLNPHNREYREASIAYFNCLKETYNPYALIDYIPHFKAMYEVYHYMNTADNYLMAKFNIARKVMRALADAEKHGEYYTEEELTKLQYALDEYSANKWLNKQNIMFKLNAGSEYLGGNGTISILEKDYEIDLSTDEGKANFKLWVEKTVIPQLKQGKINGESIFALHDNQFISDLQPDEFNHPFFRRKVPYIKLPINLLHHQSGSNSRQFDKYVQDFKKLANFKWEGLEIQDIFFIYNMLVNLNRFGATRLTSIFGPSIENGSSLAYKYNEYMGKQDFDLEYEGASIDDLNLDDILLKIAPVSSVAMLDTHKEPYVIVTRGKKEFPIIFKDNPQKRKNKKNKRRSSSWDVDYGYDEYDEYNDYDEIPSRSIQSVYYDPYGDINNKPASWFHYHIITSPSASSNIQKFKLLQSDSIETLKAKFAALIRRGNIKADLDCS